MNGLQERKRTYELAKIAVGKANTLDAVLLKETGKKGNHRSRAMSLLNKHRNELRWHQTGGKRTPQWTPDFYMTVDGIPCGAVITDYCNEPQWQNFDYILVNARGYRMKWLEPRASDSDVMKAWQESRRLERGDV